MTEVEADPAECEKELEDHTDEIQNIKHEIPSLAAKTEKFETRTGVVGMLGNQHHVGIYGSTRDIKSYLKTSQS